MFFKEDLYWEDLFGFFTLTRLSTWLSTSFKADNRKGMWNQEMWNLFNTDNKDIKKKHDKDMHSTQEKHLKKSLRNVTIC